MTTRQFRRHGQQAVRAIAAEHEAMRHEGAGRRGALSAGGRREIQSARRSGAPAS